MIAMRLQGLRVMEDYMRLLHRQGTLVLARGAQHHLCSPHPTSLPIGGTGVTLPPFLPAAVIPSPATVELVGEEEDKEKEDEDRRSPKEAAFFITRNHLQEQGKV